MLEGTLTGKDHAHLRRGLVAGHNDFGVAQGAAGLGNGGHALGNGGIHAVAEGEEAVGDQHGAGQAAAGLRRCGG